MKKQNIYMIVLSISTLLFTVSCNLIGVGSSEYTSSVDKFSVAFPSGGSDLETKDETVPYAVSARTYSKNFDNRSDNYRSYGVQVLQVPTATAEGKSEREIQEIALNGWDKEPETEIKDINVDGRKGIDSLRTVELGPASMTFREVVFWSEAEKKLYVVKVAAMKKDTTTTPEADAFIKSFKLKT